MVDTSKYKHHIKYKNDIQKTEALTQFEFEEFISLLIFTGDDGRLWCKYGKKRVYFDRLNKYYDLVTRKWHNK